MPNTVYAKSEGAKFAADHHLVCVTCATCHMLYAIPASLHRSAIDYPGDGECGWKLTCPLGHQWWFAGRSEEDRLKKDLKLAHDARARANAERDQAKASARAEKAAKTRFKRERDADRKRLASGTCPCCDREFKSLAQHMKRQHPDFAIDAGESSDVQS